MPTATATVDVLRRRGVDVGAIGEARPTGSPTSSAVGRDRRTTQRPGRASSRRATADGRLRVGDRRRRRRGRRCSGPVPPMPTGSRLRIGIASGDVSWEGGDCFGLAGGDRGPARGRRAEGGRSSSTRWSAGWPATAPAPASNRSAPSSSKGSPNRSRPSVVPGRRRRSVAERVPFPAGAGHALGARLRRARRASGARSTRLWESAAAGEPRVVLLGGEAGAGKTRLAAEFARARFAAGGGACCSAAATRELVVPYQPWVQALEQLLRVVRPDELARRDRPRTSVPSPRCCRRSTGGAGPRTTERPIDADMEALPALQRGRGRARRSRRPLAGRPGARRPALGQRADARAARDTSPARAGSAGCS